MRCISDHVAQSDHSPLLLRARTRRARDGEEFVRLFEHFVNRPDERSRIAEQALVELYAGHTVFHRIDSLLEELASLESRV